MKKKGIIVIIAVLLVALGAYTGYRLVNRGTDIIGVTTLSEKNKVIMNAKTGDEFVAGSGFITVAEGEKLHLEYNVSSGSFDIAIRADEEGVSAYQNLGAENVPTPDALPDAEDMTGEGAFGSEGITGKGSMDFEAAAGAYTVHITNHNVVGTATLTAKK